MATMTDLEKKRAVKEERLQSHYETYLQDSNTRRSQNARVADPSESVDTFLATFSQRRDKVDEKLCAIRTKKALITSEGDKASVRGELENVLLDIGDMERLVAVSSFFLPTYNVQSAQESVSKLKDDVDAAVAELLPKKKFSFRSKNANVGEEAEKKKEMPLARPVCVSDSRPNSCLDEISSLTISSNLSFQGIQDQHDSVLVRDAHDLEDREYMLSNLSNCKVYLKGKCRALFVNKLRNCQVYAGPVTGAVLVEDVDRSVLMLASHQIRIHSTKYTDFYLRVRSRPIVENTRAVRFAPYAFRYSGIEKDLQNANLLEETGLWENVDDFKWLRALQSPNWSLLPPHERASMEDAEDI